MKEIQLFSATSAAANVNSAPYNLGDLDTFSAHSTFTDGGSAGTMKVQAANGLTAPVDASTAWVTVAALNASVTSGGAIIQNASGAGYKWVRLRWEPSAGAGTMTTEFVVKENVVKGA